ncbi:MAG: hypothetical protein ACE5G0_18095 [Rhodothermales bacterium]
MKVLSTCLLALALHLVLGWAWTMGAGIAAGVWMGRRGWFVGGAGVGLSWLALIIYNYVAAGRAVQTMTQTLGDILGNLPGIAVVGLTLLIGVLIGVLGGLVGTQLGQLFKRD